MNNPLRFVDPSGMACQHEFRDGEWVDLYENGKIVIDVLTGEILERAGDLTSNQISQILREGSPYIWEKITDTLSQWYGKFGEVITTDINILWKGYGGDSAVSSDWKNYTWKQIGFSKPAYTPQEFFSEAERLDWQFGFENVITSTVGLFVGQVAKVTGDVVIGIASDVIDIANYKNTYDGSQIAYRRGNLEFDLLRIQYGPYSAYESGQNVMLSDGTIIPYDPIWG